jgi:hypothetical protein
VATSTPWYSSPTAFAARQRLARALELRVRQPPVDGQRHGDLEHPQRLDRGAALVVEVVVEVARQAPAVWTMSSSSAVPMMGTRIDP